MADSTSAPKTGTTAETAESEFSAVLLDLDKGKVHDDGTARLADLIEAVCRTGGKGKVTLTIEVEPQDPETFEGDGVLLISGKVEATIPRPKRAASVFWADGTRAVTRNDPSRNDPRDRD